MACRQLMRIKIIILMLHNSKFYMEVNSERCTVIYSKPDLSPDLCSLDLIQMYFSISFEIPFVL